MLSSFVCGLLANLKLVECFRDFTFYFQVFFAGVFVGMSERWHMAWSLLDLEEDLWIVDKSGTLETKHSKWKNKEHVTWEETSGMIWDAVSAFSCGPNQSFFSRTTTPANLHVESLSPSQANAKIGSVILQVDPSQLHQGKHRAPETTLATARTKKQSRQKAEHKPEKPRNVSGIVTFKDVFFGLGE